jgi:hypothetical protein
VSGAGREDQQHSAGQTDRDETLGKGGKSHGFTNRAFDGS